MMQGHKVHRLILTIVAFSVLLFSLMTDGIAASSAGAARVAVHPTAAVAGSRVHLGEIADVTGRDAQLVDRLKGLVVGTAPLPGRSRRFDRDYIVSRLKQQRVDLDGLQVDIPEQVEISRKKVVISCEKIRRVIAEKVYERLPEPKNRTRIKTIRIGQDVVLPDGRVTYTLDFSKTGNRSDAIPVCMVFRVDGKVSKKLWVTVQLEIFEQVVVARHPIKRRQVITETDVQLAERDVAGMGNVGIRQVEAVIGKRARRSIRAGRVLQADLVELPALVRRGDVIAIVAESKGMKITTLGQARKDGRRGGNGFRW